MKPEELSPNPRSLRPDLSNILMANEKVNRLNLTVQEIRGFAHCVEPIIFHSWCTWSN